MPVAAGVLDLYEEAVPGTFFEAAEGFGSVGQTPDFNLPW